MSTNSPGDDEITALALDFLAREETIVKALTKRERETAKRRELGLCIKCGKPAAPKATCAECGIKANARRKPRASKRGGFDGTVSVRVD